MRWHLLQMAILIGVLFSNIHWQWTPNNYLASALGIAAAWLVTVVVVKLADVLRRR